MVSHSKAPQEAYNRKRVACSVALIRSYELSFFLYLSLSPFAADAAGMLLLLVLLIYSSYISLFQSQAHRERKRERETPANLWSIEHDLLEFIEFTALFICMIRHSSWAESRATIPRCSSAAKILLVLFFFFFIYINSYLVFVHDRYGFNEDIFFTRILRWINHVDTVVLLILMNFCKIN